MSASRTLLGAVAAACAFGLAAPALATPAALPVHDALYTSTSATTGSFRPAEPLRHTGVTWRADDPDVTDYLIIGASMTTVLVSDWGHEAYDLLASRHEFFLDARGCRTLTGPSCSTGGEPPPNTIDTLRARAGTFDKGLVILVGANDPNLGEYGMDASITTILAEAKRQGIRWVVWFTYNEASSVGRRMARHNAVLWERAADEPRLVVGDWNARVQQLPASWLFGDGIHLGSDAAVELADLIADTLDLIDAAGPGDTACPWLRTPAAADGATYGAPTGSLPRSAKGTLRATRLQVRCIG